MKVRPSLSPLRASHSQVRWFHTKHFVYVIYAIYTLQFKSFKVSKMISEGSCDSEDLSNEGINKTEKSLCNKCTLENILLTTNFWTVLTMSFPSIGLKLVRGESSVVSCLWLPVLGTVEENHSHQSWRLKQLFFSESSWTLSFAHRFWSIPNLSSHL